MITALIIEDEINAREALKKMIHLIAPEIVILGETGFVKEAVQLIRLHKPSIVFMDIALEDGESFEILEQLGQVSFKIIFTTAYNQFAVKAFKYSTIDYLLKPIDPLDLKVALTKAIEALSFEIKHAELLEVLHQNLHKSAPTIVLKTADYQYVIPLKNIIRLLADGAYTTFITVDKQIVMSKNIKYYQELLADGFLRCHQSHLVNLSHVLGMQKKAILEMSNGDLVPVSTRKKSEIQSFLNNK
ncbi:MAG: DNA-binding response regulator [Flavobacteriaceae bacterium]|nr:MAG: DNA-binding response regulator [Flavobacteriaceae bacterium]